mgnify:FL=1
MTESNIWSVDRIAAGNLLLSLGVKLDPADELLIAEHFARHRRDAQEWAAERARDRIVSTLETASLELCPRSSDDWSLGFQRAEQMVMTMTPNELIGTEVGKARSKGQVLRALVRHAKAAAQADGSLS